MFFTIDFSNDLALYDQIIRQVKFAVAGEVLKPGEMIPSVRELARELTLNPNTVARAYRQLQTDGILTALMCLWTDPSMARGVLSCSVQSR